MSAVARTPATERLLVATVCVVVFVDTMLFAVIAPLLPGLAHELHLSKLSAGVLTASYPFGMLVAALPCGVLAARVGPRLTVCLGLALCAVSTAAFAFLHNIAALDLARAVEGVGGACSWGGGMAWIAVDTAVERRGAMMGYAVAAAIAGGLFGPVAGTVATVTGRPLAFGALAVAAAGLIPLVSRLPSSHRPSQQGLRDVLEACRRPDVAWGMWLMALPAIASGSVNVLGPLRLHRLGATATAIGATFLIAAALAAAVSPAVGRFSDRHGRLAPLKLGLGVAAVALACFTVPTDVVPLALVIIVVSVSLATFWAPTMALLSDAAGAQGLEQGFAGALSNLAWAGGQVVGAGVGGALAKSAGDGLPMHITSALCAATLALLVLGRVRRRTPAVAGGATGGRPV